MKNVLAEIRKNLSRVADEKTKAGAKRYFKEKINVYGVTMPQTEKIAKQFFPRIRSSGKKDIFFLCEELFKSGYFEEVIIAANFIYRIKNKYEKTDIVLFEKWIDRYIDNWAECDTFCNHAVAALIERYPRFISKLKGWAKSKNMWMRRAAAVTLILPARRGKYLTDIFQIADILLLDNEDLVQKGYGWMLKAASQSHQKEVFDYVMKNKASMPRTALRYAIEKMSEKLKKIAMARERTV